MAELGVNTIRVEDDIDVSRSHDACMAIFAGFGIYVIIELESFYSQINAVCFAVTFSEDECHC